MSASPTYEHSPQVAEASRETMGAPVFGGAVPRRLPARPDPPPARGRPAREAEGEAYLATLRAFLTEHVDPVQIERDAKIPDDVLDGLKELGALGMKIAEEYGGLGPVAGRLQPALALAGTWHSSLATLLSAHQSIGLPEPLRLFGSEEQKREWLPKVAATHVSAFLLTEPDVGSDPARMATTAVPTEDGTRLPHHRHEAVGDERRDRRRRRRHGGRARSARATAAASRAFICPMRRRGRHGRRTATRSWACAASRTR